MSRDLIAQLKQIGLTQIPPDASNPQTRWAFEAAAALTDPAGVPSGLPDVRIGVGNAPDADALFGAIRTAECPGLVDALGAAQAVWLGTGTNATIVNGVPDRPVWFAVFSTEGVDVLGMHPIAVTALNAPGVLDFPAPLLLRVRLRLHGNTLERADASVEGPVRVLTDIGPVELNGVDGTFVLALKSVNPANFGTILSNPEAVLDTQFQAHLAIELRTSQPVGLLDATLSGSQVVRLDADVTSPSRSRSLSLDRVAYQHDISGGLSIGGGVPVTTGQLTLQGEFGPWTAAGPASVSLTATTTLTLPPQVRAIVTSASSSISGSLQLVDTGRGAGRLTTVDLTLGELTLAPAVNPLELTARSMVLRVSKRGNAPWMLSFATELRQSWRAVARRLKAAHIVELPEIERLPDLICRSSIDIGATRTDVTLRFELAEDGRLGPLPLDAADTFFELKAQAGGAWSATGGGRFTSREELAAIVPFQELPVTCSLSVPAGGATPQLDFTIGAGLPPLKLPPLARGGPPIELLRLNDLTLHLGSQLEVVARVSLLPALGNTAARLGLPTELRPLLDPLIATVQGSTGELRFWLRDNQPSLSIQLAAGPSTPTLDLLGLFAQAVPGRSAAPAAGALASTPMGPLLLLRPATLVLETSAAGEDGPRLRIALAAVCTVLDETFDATLSISANGRHAEVSLLGGTTDPLLIRIPGSDTRALVAAVDQQIRHVLNLYGVSQSSQAARDLEAVGAGLRGILGSPEADTLIAFEIVNFGLTLRLDPAEEPLAVTGGIRIVQFPPILDLIFAGPTPALIIGSSGTSIFIELQPAPASGAGTPPSPLIRIPVTRTTNVDVVIHALRFGYSWQPPSFELTLRSDVIAPDMPFRGGVGFKLPAGSATGASASMDIDLQIPSPPAPPVPMLNWQMSFLGANPTTSTRGLEFIVGASDTNRLLTIYLRETVFSPCFFLLMPGGMIDWGLFIGPPPEARTSADFYFDFRCGRGTMITLTPTVGVMLNPTAVLPPFLTATPPYWIIPGLLMGDYFTDESAQTGVELRANIPLLVEFDTVVKRPLPTLDLQMFLEVALLVIKEFDVELPANSALKKLFYASLSGRVHIPALDALFGAGEADLAADIEFNIVEILNGAIRLKNQIRDVIDDAGRAMARATAMVGDLATHPDLLVRLVPRQHRSVAIDTRLEALGFSLDCHLSAYLLLPDELREELRMYHEDVRPRRRNPGGIRERPPSGATISNPTVLDRDAVLTLDRLADPLGFVRGASVARLDLGARGRVRDRVKGPLELTKTRVVEGAAARLAADIDSARGASRRDLLVRHGLASAEHDIDRDDRTIRDRVRFRTSVADRIRPQLQRTATYSIEITHQLTASAAVLAARIVEDGILHPRGGRPAVTPAFRSVLERHLPRPMAKALAADLQLELVRLLPPTTLSPQQFDRVRAQLTAIAASAIERAAVIGRQDAITESAMDGAAEATIAGSLMRGRPNSKVTLHADTKRPPIFRGGQLRDWFGGFRPGIRDIGGTAPPTDTDAPQGYEIRLRKEHIALAPAFAVAVLSPATRFQVKLQGGAYRLIVRSGSSTTTHDLPAALVGAVPVSPRKAGELQRRLQIAERYVHRPLTPGERNLQQEGGDQHIAGLHRKSIFYSPEYDIRPEGGKRGALNLADLLRKADGSYIVPAQPMAIAGFRVQLLKRSTVQGGLNASFHVRFCGLVAPGSHMLCFGFAEHTLRFGSLRAEVRGEFRLAVGDIATVSLPGAAGLAPDSMSFEGTLLLRDGSRELLSGEATATIAKESNVTTMRLKTTVHIEWSDEFEVGELKLLKAWLSADVDVSLTLGRTLQASLDTSITLRYAFGEFDTDMVTVGIVLCIPATNVCWRESTTIEVPDFSEMRWGAEKSLSGRLKLSLDSGASGAAFAGSITANIPTPSGGTFALNATLPSFAL
jgi:hypothetical protein